MYTKISGADQHAGAPQSNPHPIKELVIRDERFPGGYSELLAKIDERGQLVLDGAGASESVRQYWGDWDYEYSETVPAAWKDTVLLHLIKDRFATNLEFRKWCQEHNIPVDHWSFA